MVFKMVTNVTVATIQRISYQPIRLSATNDAMVTEVKPVGVVGE